MIVGHEVDLLELSSDGYAEYAGVDSQAYQGK